MLSRLFRRFLHPETAQDTKRVQYIRGGLLGLFLLIFSYIVIVVFFNQKEDSSKVSQKTSATSIETTSQRLDLNEVWRHKIQDQYTAQSQDISSLKSMFEENVKRQDEMSLPPSYESEAKLSALEARFDEKLNQISSNYVNISSGVDVEGEGEGRVIQKITLNLTASRQKKVLRTVENTIPSGSFAKALLLSGVDASAALGASANPGPLLLRIIGSGNLPQRFLSDLKDCHCTTGAYGDASSQRVYIRLEKLSCVDRKTGEIFEKQVSGFVTGPDGKAGIRGVVASMDGQFLGKSLLGGMFAGFSDVANPENRRSQVNPFFAGNPQISKPGFDEMFTSGMAKGVSSSLSRLSQYYIDRAEQIQPIIQVDSGQIVDVVFTEGFSFDNSVQSSEEIKPQRRVISQGELP